MAELNDAPVDADRVITVLGNRLAGLVGRAHADEIVRNAQLEVLAATLIAERQMQQAGEPESAPGESTS